MIHIVSRTEDERGRIFRLSDGRDVIIDDNGIGFAGSHFSAADYYFSRNPGYGCATEEEAALLYAKQFPKEAGA